MQAGQPVLRVREGRLQDGVVVSTEAGGLRLLCAIAVSGRLAGSNASGGRACAAAYQCATCLLHALRCDAVSCARQDRAAHIAHSSVVSGIEGGKRLR